jgi:HEAT repeat protein
MNLTEALQSPDFGTRIRAVIALRPLPPEEALPLLEIALTDSNTRVRYSAVSLLGQKPGPQTRALLTQLLHQDPEFDVRAAAAASLGDLGDKDAFEDLKQAYLNDGQDLVRFSIVAALGELGDPRAFDLLITALKAGGLQEEAALMALGQIALPEVIPVLQSYLPHPDWQLRLRAVQALAEINTPASLACLVGLQEDNPTVAQAISAAGR